MSNFRYCLNTSTILPASLMEKIRAAERAGYEAIELWANDCEEYVASGGTLADLRKVLDDAGLQRPSMINLKDWCVVDDAAWHKASDELKGRLALAAELGVECMVAGPTMKAVPLETAVKRYRQVLELSLKYEVPASLEFLGFVEGINTLEKAWEICAAVDHPAATLTADAWHIYRGGSDVHTLLRIPPGKISRCFHWNDAPPYPLREVQTDNDRVMPGDGILDLPALAGILKTIGWSGYLSLELFHPLYWKEDPLEVARLGLEKMRSGIE